MENFILTISYLLLGMGLRRVPQFPKETATVLNLFIIYISLPALVLLKVPGLQLTADLLAPVLMPWAMLLCAAAIVIITARFARWDKTITGALLLLVPLGNTSFLGIPMVRAFFGEAGIPFAVLYDQLGSFLALATYGAVVIAVYGEGQAPSLQKIVLRIATFPPFICLIIAFTLLKGITYPGAVATLLNSLAATLVPVVMIAVGFQLTLRLDKKVLAPLGFGIATKLLISPAIALALCSFFGADNLPAKVAIFEAGMPPMVSAGALAIIAGLSPQLTAALVGLGIFVSFATLPLLFALL